MLGVVSPAGRVDVGAPGKADAVRAVHVLVHELLGLEEVVGKVHHERQAACRKDCVNVALGGALVGTQLLVTVHAPGLEAGRDKDEWTRRATGHVDTFRRRALEPLT